MPQAADTSPKGPRILLAEDDHEMRSLLALTLRQAKYQVLECEDGLELLEHLRARGQHSSSRDYDLLISDIRMPGMEAFEVLEKVGARPQGPPVMLITSFGDDQTHRKAESLGVAIILDKPFATDDFLAKVRELVPFTNVEG